MFYDDLLYGIQELPDYIMRFGETYEMVRLRQMSLLGLPNRFIMRGPFQSQLQHSLGVAHLATRVTKRNKITDHADQFIVAAFLHALAQPVFEDLIPVNLFLSLWRNPTIFFREAINHTETERLLIKQFGLDLGSIDCFIMQGAGVFAQVFDGFTGLDHLDTAARVCAGVTLRNHRQAVLEIADSFRLVEDRWVLLEESRLYVNKLIVATDRVYDYLGSNSYAAASTMLARAIEFGFLHKKEQLKPFFLLDDEKALEWLLYRGGEDAAYITENALRWRWYTKVFETQLSGCRITPCIESFADDWRARHQFARMISASTDILERDICVAATSTTHHCRTAFPYLMQHGHVVQPQKPREEDKRFVLSVYVHPDQRGKRLDLNYVIRQELKKILYGGC